MGYIGSTTIVELLKYTKYVICVDDLSNSSEKILKNLFKLSKKKFYFLKLDLSKKSSIKKILNLNLKIETIIHFAAKKYVFDSIKDPLSYYSNNINITINLLALCNSFRKINFVFSSSCTVYGKVDSFPVSEKTPLNESLNPYGETKQICEKIIENYSNINDNFKFCCLRYFNPAGAHSSSLIGENPKAKYKNLVPSICDAYKFNKPIYIFGNDYSTPDGSCIRDFIHVEDVAIAHVKTIKYLKKTNKSKIKKYLNLGMGRGYSVKEIINKYETVNSVSLKKVYKPRRKGDIAKIWANNYLIKKELNWKPIFSIQDIVKSAHKWSFKKIKKQN